MNNLPFPSTRGHNVPQGRYSFNNVQHVIRGKRTPQRNGPNLRKLHYDLPFTGLVTAEPERAKEK